MDILIQKLIPLNFLSEFFAKFILMLKSPELDRSNFEILIFETLKNTSHFLSSKFHKPTPSPLCFHRKFVKFVLMFFLGQSPELDRSK